MSFFSRSKKMLAVLIALCVVVAITMFFMLYEIVALGYDYLVPSFFVCLAFWIVILLITVALRCITKDAEEDMNALTEYLNSKIDKK